MHRALITGGTSGIGAAFSKAFAERGVHLVIVARDAERLESFAHNIRTSYGVEVETLRADLQYRDDLERVKERVSQNTPEKQEIDILVNNAGFSVRTDILGEDVDLHDAAFEVMIRGVFHLSNVAGRAFSARGRGWIINVNSVSGHLPQNNYSAIKAWGLNFTEALAVRLAGSGVRVTSLEPGWVRTEFHSRAGVKGSSIPDFLWLNADKLVEECLRDVAKGKVISIPSGRFQVLAFLARIAPRPILHSVSAWFTARRNREK